jgi:hypothetical protein
MRLGVIIAIALASPSVALADTTTTRPPEAPVARVSQNDSKLKAFGPAVWGFLNTEFVAALVAGLAGAGVGAYGGASIVQRQGARKAALEEVRAANVAIALSLFVLNWTLALKRQHLRGMVARYDADKKRHEAALRAGQELQTLQFDLETLPVVDLPIQPLKETVYTRVDADLAYAMCATLAGVVSALLSALEQRNDLIAERQQSTRQTDDDRAEFYFGLRREDGVIDARYPTLLDAISHYADATILYSAILAALLMDRGNLAAETLGKKAPKVTRMNLKQAFADRLIPDLNEYADMLDNMGIDASLLLKNYGGP